MLQATLDYLKKIFLQNGYQRRIPRGFQGKREHGLKIIGKREQKENKAWNTGTKAVFREQGTPKLKNAFREQGNTRKILLGTREHGPHWEAVLKGIISHNMKDVSLPKISSTENKPSKKAF